MINTKRLSKIIQTRDSERTQNSLLEFYSKLNVKERSIIKSLFNKKHE